MRLTAILFRRNRMPHGHVMMGKDRFVKDITPKAFRAKMLDLEIEEKNMLLLRHPYLSEAQSRGHASALNKKSKFMANILDKYRMRRHDDVTIGERLAHLSVTDAWEKY